MSERDCNAGDRATGRRDFLHTALLGAPALLIAGCSHVSTTDHRAGGAASEGNERGGANIPVTPNEDLMREHGLLQRCLLCYDAIARRLADGESVPDGALMDTAHVVRRFVEEYHERIEERFVFPRLHQAGVLVATVQTLRLQHNRGRAVTDVILSNGADVATSSAKRQAVLAAIHSYQRMYRPHEAREDTVVFPAFKGVVTPSEYRELGERFEDIEHQKFGKDGFKDYVTRVATIEQRLGIHDLSQFTPKVPPSAP